MYPDFSRQMIAHVLGRTDKSVASRAKVLGIRRGDRTPWSASELHRLRAIYPHRSTSKVAEILGRSVCSVNSMASTLRLHKTEKYLASTDACRLRRGNNVGWAHRFPKGHVPANKGMRRPGWAPGRMAETQFKKGNHPHTWVPIGSTRLSKEGYLQRKVSDTGYTPRDWKGVHILMWEKANGPVPAGHAVTFQDRDKSHIALENLELITRAELMARNTIHNLPEELKGAIRAVASLNRAIRRKTDGKK